MKKIISILLLSSLFNVCTYAEGNEMMFKPLNYCSSWHYYQGPSIGAGGFICSTYPNSIIEIPNKDALLEKLNDMEERIATLEAKIEELNVQVIHNSLK